MRRHVQVRVEEPSGPLGSGSLGAPGVELDKVPAWEFDEGAAQVQRLLQRDRKELTGVEEIGASFSAEFDDGKEAAAQEAGRLSSNGAASSSSPAPGSPFGAASAPPKPMSPFGAAALRSSAFGAGGGQGTKAPGGPANPFSGAGGAKLFTENAQLSPTMEPDAFVEKPWWQNIKLGQIVIFLSFTTIIGVMVGTFFVVLKAGGVHFNE
ncbi:hypothetical protein WJX81_007800 [Elliptochloris bilobata]|uniref:Uncharacterized protein n=1 Tax=Elliptochloris bilobata TaxID=381761 RepID=A0AAW1R068_9CHLO